MLEGADKCLKELNDKGKKVVSFNLVIKDGSVGYVAEVQEGVYKDGEKNIPE